MSKNSYLDLASQDEIKRIPGLSLELVKNLEKYNTFRLKAIGDFVTVSTVDSLKELLKVLNSRKLKYKILGWGSNLVLPESADWIYVYLDLPYDKSIFDKPKSLYNLNSSISLNLLTLHAIKFGLVGWEVFTGIPASLGGAIYMNAGTNLGEIGKIVRKVYIVTNLGLDKEHVVNEASFSYRKNNFLDNGDIIVAADLTHFGQSPEISKKIKDYQVLRKNTQPLSAPTCGCVFKNPKDSKGEYLARAGQLIDQAGLKDLRVGDLRVSPLHANFFENMGNATKNDFIKLIQEINNVLESRHGIKLELEVEVW